ncbi:E3 ubiquitin-protein ligase PRT1-like [Corylus avellana]|uniref:E3 ubiquitin-protein ligase PRT1-like n=1 Tax=Corylus avellana TaxID=13451 RepID=UPI00286CFC07|nr:E3 ubiquitin-protein ligase PRT1-like [Corylus avellana]XP_059433523.1 E3 ubiquitin-protein ligase PRT1-like [Corylus avellana]
MEDLTLHNDVESEEIYEPFYCCVCLDLLFKPIVLSCGHISCFWCVHNSMSGRHESRCPLCRHPYYHFPTICQMLHVLLLKMYPVAYKKRENITLEEEVERGVFSPQCNAQACVHQGDPTSFSTMDFESNSSSDPSSTRKGEPYTNQELLLSDSLFQNCGTCTLIEISDGNSDVIRNVAIEEKNCKQVSVADVLCSACKQLLYHPVVLNCGHVYCESCVIIPTGEMLKCHVCQTLHPKGFPKVCLVLDQFLEEQFPKEYVLRRDAVQLKQVDFEHKKLTICSSSSEAGKQGENLLQSHTRSNIHLGVGCDSCGIFPILGDRYRCKDCVEIIGFDLCGDCYNTRSKLPGRFNQQHTPEHKFELVRPFRNMLGLMAIELEDNSLLIDTDASEDSENGSPAPGSPSSAQENAESDWAATSASTDGGEDQTGSQSTT